MVALAHRRRSSTWIRVGCLLGLTACLGCGSTPPAPPGEVEYRQGCQLLAQAVDGLGESKLCDAAAEFDKAVKANPRHTKAIFCSANAHERLGETDLAIADYSKILDFDAENVDALCGRGATYLKKGLPEQAIVDLNKAVLNARDSYQAWCLLAQAHLAAEKYVEASDDARSAIQRNPKCGEAFRTLGVSLLALPSRQADEPVKCFREAINLYKSSPPSAANLAQVYYDLGTGLDRIGDRTEANKAFDEAIRLEPRYARATPKPAESLPDPKLADEATRAKVLDHFDRANTYFKEKNFELASASLDEAKRLERSLIQRDRQFERRILVLHADVCRSQARDYLDSRQWEKAIASLLAMNEMDNKYLTETGQHISNQQLGTIDQQFAQVYQELGADRLKSQQWDEAIDALLKAQSLDKGRAWQLNRLLAQAYAGRGFDRANQHAFSEAVADLNRALGLYKYSAQTYRLCGLTCCLMAEACHDRGLNVGEVEQWDAAIKHLNQAIRLDRTLDYELRPMLEYARQNYARLTPTPTGAGTN